MEQKVVLIILKLQDLIAGMHLPLLSSKVLYDNELQMMRLCKANVIIQTYVATIQKRNQISEQTHF